MLGAFVDLTLWSVRNRLRVRLRRLREPRYLISAVVGFAWFGFFVLRPFLLRPSAGRPVVSPLAAAMASADTVRFAVGLALAGLALLVAWWPGERRPLEFSQAEVQFLFPAPISRRQLLHYKLLRSQGGLLLSAAIATVFLRPGTLANGWRFSVGLWLGLATCRLYSIGVGLGAGALRRRWALVAASLAAAAVLASSAAPSFRALAALATWGERLEVLRHVWSSGSPRVVLWPFMTLARLPLAGSTPAFWSGLPGVLLLLFATYNWVLRTDTAFEEASAAQAAKPAAAVLRTPTVRKGRAAPFPLALVGRPETAILWKNLILLGRYASVKTLLRFLPLFILFPLFATGGKHGGNAPVFLAVSLTALFMLVVVGPGAVRNDLRQDLGRLAVLKSWPISGAALVRGELLAPAIVLTLASWGPVLVGALALANHAPARLAAFVPSLVSYAAAAMLAAPALILAQLVVQNGLAVLLPAWIVTGRKQNAGLERMGQGMLSVWGGFLASAVTLAPALLIAFAVRAALSSVPRGGGTVVAAAVLLSLVVLQSLLVTGWLGRVVDRSDLASIDPLE